MSRWSTAPKWIEFSQILSKSHWGPSLSALGAEQQQGQSLMSGVLVRSDRDGPSCATLTCRRARLGLQTDHDGWIKRKHFLSLRTSGMDSLTAILPMASLPPHHSLLAKNYFEQSKMESESRLIATRQSGGWWHDFLDPLFMPLHLALERA